MCYVLKWVTTLGSSCSLRKTAEGSAGILAHLLQCSKASRAFLCGPAVLFATSVYRTVISHRQWCARSLERITALWQHLLGLGYHKHRHSYRFCPDVTRLYSAAAACAAVTLLKTMKDVARFRATVAIKQRPCWLLAIPMKTLEAVFEGACAAARSEF